MELDFPNTNCDTRSPAISSIAVVYIHPEPLPAKQKFSIETA